MTELAALATLPGLPFEPQQLLTQQPHGSEELAGWIGLATWTLKAEDGSFWDLDWRYAFGPEIFKQHWIDFGWDETKLLHRPKRKDPARHKLILYVCAEGTNVPAHYSGFQGTEHDGFSGALVEPLGHPIPERYAIGKYWETIHRGLLPLSQLPTELHPLLPDSPPPCRESPLGDFATTRTLHDTPPEIINNPEDEVQTVIFLPEGEERQGEGGLRTKALYKHPGTEDAPLISVITVVYNNVALLEQTMQSVINQAGDRVEYIVIDGGSSDGTVELIQHYEDQINYWVSEKDRGIYDAMNKGLSLIVGDWVNFMNSGDLFYQFPCEFESDLIYGNTLIKYPHKCRKSLSKKLSFIEKDIIASHQSIYFSRYLYKKHIYQTEYRFAADFSLLLDLFQKNQNWTQQNKVISITSSQGTCDLNRVEVHKEYLEILKK